jgi:hypothetical protein
MGTHLGRVTRLRAGLSHRSMGPDPGRKGPYFMSAPTRKPVVIAEATQELRAADVVGVLGTVESGGVSTAGVALPRKSLSSQSSIAPVGLDLKGGAADMGEDDDILDAPLAVAQPARRRRLGKIVVGAVAACAVILIAAGVARIGHAMSEPGTTPSTASTSTNGANASTGAPSPGATTTTASPATVGAAAPTDPASAGTVRLAKPTLAGHVWLDGKKVSATSVLVSCGTHQLKVGHGRKHSIDVPCGGEIAVSR